MARGTSRIKRSRDDAPAPAVLPACTLERLIGRPRAAWKLEHLLQLFHDRGMRLVALMHIGGDGWLKTLDFVPRNLDHLRDILEGGERADGSSLFAGMGIKAGASDVVLRPRLDTAFIDPFAAEPTLAFLCSHYGKTGEPLPESPDTVVRLAYERLKAETGVDLWALGEVEYFLGKQCAEGDAYGADERGYHATSPFVFGEVLRRKAIIHLAEMGIPVKYSHSEVGYIEASPVDPVVWEQHEVELALAPLPRAAEAVPLTMWVLRNLGIKYGMRTSFNPIVRPGHAGSGMHFHFSPTVDGKHLGGRNDKGELTHEAKWLIAGLVELGATLMAFGNRDYNSFVRLSQGKEVPRTVSWGEFNRHALVRLPIVPRTADGRTTAAPTIEFRLPDGSGFPHLLLAGVAQAMTHGRSTQGIDLLLERTAAGHTSNGADEAHLPRNFGEVADLLKAHRQPLEAGGVFAPRLIDSIEESLRKRV
jgi:glutamine synthetase